MSDLSHRVDALEATLHSVLEAMPHDGLPAARVANLATQLKEQQQVCVYLGKRLDEQTERLVLLADAVRSLRDVLMRTPGHVDADLVTAMLGCFSALDGAFPAKPEPPLQRVHVEVYRDGGWKADLKEADEAALMLDGSPVAAVPLGNSSASPPALIRAQSFDRFVNEWQPDKGILAKALEEQNAETEKL